jgi:plasmid maintenance system antidote protein VapI
MGGARKRRGRPRKRETPLSRWIDRAGKTRDEVAERLVITRTHLDRLCNAARRPSLELALEIEKLTDGEVPASVWTRVPAHSRD